MRFAFSGATRQAGRPVRSIACLAFVGALGTAFWAGAVYIGETVLRMAGTGF